jgi:hypothetical protein
MRGHGRWQRTASPRPTFESVRIGFRTTIVMKTQGLSKDASCVFGGVAIAPERATIGMKTKDLPKDVSRVFGVRPIANRPADTTPDASKI